MRDVGRSIPQLLEAQARRAPDAAAIMAPGQVPLSYESLWGSIREVVATLRGIGLGSGARVAVLASDGPELAVAVLAVAAGATCIPLNPSLRGPELEAALTDLTASAILIDAGLDTPARAVASRRGLPILDLMPTHGAPAGHFRLSGAGTLPPVTFDFATEHDVALVLLTSGTTARPKRVPLTHANLCASARNIATTLTLDFSDRCLNVMPLFHIHGLVAGLLASLGAGASVVCPPGFLAPKFFAWLAEFRPTWYTAVPTIHQAVLARAPRHPEVIAACPLRFIRSSSAPMPASLLLEIERVFGVPVIEAYGMTEASHQIASNPLPPKTRKPGSVGLPAGSEVAILDPDGRVLPSGTTGEVAIRGANVTRSYEDDTAANEAALAHGWLRTGDLGQLDSDGYLTITGRLKELINRAGEKVSPPEVESVLLAHPVVAQALVFPVPSARLGEEVAAAVVRRSPVNTTARELRAFAAARLAPFKVPAQVVFVDTLPTGPTGKLQRHGLAATLRLTPAEPPSEREETDTPPRTVLEAYLAEIWADVLGHKRHGIHEHFLQAGGDSILAAGAITRIRNILGVDISFVDFFEYPTIAEMAAMIETGECSQRALDAPAEAPRIPRLDHHDGAALSYAQERLWFLDRLEPGGITYNRPVLYDIDGPLDMDVLRRSLNEVVRRHESLRTACPDVDGRPAQTIQPELEVALRIVDLSGLHADLREIEARQQALADARQPFDLARGPLVRATVFRLADHRHWLLWCTHHIVFDRWSQGVFQRELSALYPAFAASAASPLPALGLQYADYAAGQRALVERAGFVTRVAAWATRLAGMPPTTGLIPDRWPAPSTPRGARQPLSLPGPLVDSLERLGRQRGATPFMTLLAGFAALLVRYTGQTDLVVGVPMAGRQDAETAQLIGLFINTVPLRCDLSGDPSFVEALDRIRKSALVTYANQDIPLQALIEQVQPRRVVGRHPLFQMLFNYQNVPLPPVSIPGITVTGHELDIGTAKLDLAVELSRTTNGLDGALEYDANRFDAASVARLGDHYRRLLEGVVADPTQCVSALPLLDDAERHQLLVEWNASAADAPPPECIHERFAVQALASPEATAVVHGDAALTYRELDRRANQLAHYLRALGVGPETRIGLCVARSLDTFVGVLGILKAGAAYVPLDPAYPEPRLAFMLADAQAPVLVTQDTLRQSLPKHDGHVVYLDADWPTIAREPEDAPATGVTGDHLAYVIYTSGSIGQPKGVLITHRALVNHNAFFARRLRLRPNDRVLQFASLSFDAAAEEIFPTWLSGAGITTRPDDLLEPAALLRFVEMQRISVLNIPTAFWHRLVDVLSTTALRMPESVRTVIIGGEKASAKRFAAWQRLDLDIALMNTYGPTETTIVATIHEPSRETGSTAAGASSRSAGPLPTCGRTSWTRTSGPSPLARPESSTLAASASLAATSTVPS